MPIDGFHRYLPLICACSRFLRQGLADSGEIFAANTGNMDCLKPLAKCDADGWLLAVRHYVLGRMVKAWFSRGCYIAKFLRMDYDSQEMQVHIHQDDLDTSRIGIIILGYTYVYCRKLLSPIQEVCKVDAPMTVIVARSSNGTITDRC